MNVLNVRSSINVLSKVYVTLRVTEKWVTTVTMSLLPFLTSTNYQ